METHLVIVESPAKARTLTKYLGSDYTVLASYGHVRDLRPKEGAVEPDNGFAMHYEPIEKNERHVSAIAKAMRKADSLYLATDPDREGEAISWHLVELLRGRRALGKKPVYRVAFHEITKSAVREAIENPRELALDLVNAQQARRALDYLVGFNLSPLLWKKIRRGLSAGRVQSPALRLIAERELEIEAFEQREYWTIEADLSTDDQEFVGRLIRLGEDKLERFSIESEKQAGEAVDRLQASADGQLIISTVTKKQRRRNPAAPFTTSTLQQEAARKLGFTADRTMRVAQQLYEGIEGDSGLGGLITYMRTDSVTLAADAIEEIRAFVKERYGADRVPGKPRVYRTKAKNAQEAHEAIRPTSVQRTPDSLGDQLNAEQAKLYGLIWKRTVACQMKHALIDTVTADMDCGGEGVFRATGSVVADPGFMAVYQEGKDEQGESDEQGRLPVLAEGQQVPLRAIRPEQHFTEPPPRYSEASLIKTLEEHGIGRPSTYASIIATLKQREYVVIDKRRFFPTDVGRVVNRFLTEHFGKYVDYDFTARMEDDLDAISRGEKEWVPLLEGFWGEFKSLVTDKEANVQRSDVTQEGMDEACPECSKPLSIRLGRRGRFIGCTAFPECKYTRSLNDNGDKDETPAVVAEGRTCPKCESPLLVKEGRYGKFLGCSGYPECRHLEPLEKPTDTGVDCPECKKGSMLKRKSRRGKVFYSCAKYPTCKYACWNEPLAEACPTCSWPILTLKTTKRRGTEKVCPQKECDFVEQVALPETVNS